MKNKKPTQKEIKDAYNYLIKKEEINKAFEILKKHNVSVFTLEDKEFLEEWIFENWELQGIKPTTTNLKLVREKAMDLICAESWELMQDAIKHIASQQKNTIKK